MGITIKDIAKIANVSYSTVSKALNDSPLVKASTKNKIIEIANELGYEPNFAAQRLVSKQTRVIGLIWPTIERIVLSTLVTEINHEFNKTPYSMILSVESAKTALDTFKRFQVDGIILFEEGVKMTAIQSSIPLLSYGVAKNQAVGYPIIDANHEQAMHLAVKYLYELGHKHIIYIGDLSSDDLMQTEKHHGFVKAMKNFHLPLFPESTVDTKGLDWFDGYTTTKKQLANHHYPTAIVGGSYDISNGIIRAVREQGIQIPQQISVISYDNIPQMENTEIPLTCIGVPVDQLAKEIAQSIIHFVENTPSQPHIKKMTPILTKRLSCSAVQ